MAVLNFVEVEELAGMSDAKMAEISRRRADEIHNLSYVALGLLRKSKDGLVDSLRESRNGGNDHVWRELLDMLSQDTARALLQFYSAAEARLMVAMARAANEKPDGPGGGEEIPDKVVAA